MPENARWGEIKAGEIISHIKGKLIAGNENKILSGISTDTRDIVNGQLFLALKGDRYDGHDFVGKAIEKGASAVIIERFGQIDLKDPHETAIIRVTDTQRALGDLAHWWRRQHKAGIVAITGSTGKTTVKEMTAGILGLKVKTLKNMGNLNNLIGLPLTLLGLEYSDQMAVLEMGMNRMGEIGRLTEISDPDIGLITNVARAHLEGLGDLEGVVKAKTELVERISDQAKVILNGDDDLLMRTASRFPKKIMTYGLNTRNDVIADNIVLAKDLGIGFRIRHKGGSIPVKIKIPGRQNVINALAASAVAICLNIKADLIKKGLEGFEGVQGRFSPVSLPGDILLIDDTYNANPASLKVALESVRELAFSNRRLIVGLGEMMELGNETVFAHVEAGNLVAEAGAAYLFALGDHAAEMINGGIEGGIPEKRAKKVQSQEEMVQKISSVLRGGELILLKGSRKAGLDVVARELVKRTRKEG